MPSRLERARTSAIITTTSVAWYESSCTSTNRCPKYAKFRYRSSLPSVACDILAAIVEPDR
jgi:hypothetical protein